jgi:hypothetical protein
MNAKKIVNAEYYLNKAEKAKDLATELYAEWKYVSEDPYQRRFYRERQIREMKRDYLRAVRQAEEYALLARLLKEKEEK